jgi:mannan endo-1,4-beta-mannosidase
MKKRLEQMTLFTKLWLMGGVIFFFCSLTGFAQTGTLVTSIEAESGILSGGVTIDNSIEGFSGTGYVTNFKSSADKVTVTVTVPKKAFYSVYISYHSEHKKQYISVNGGGASEVDFMSTDKSFGIADAGKYPLNAGDNTITLQSGWGYADIDQFLVYTTLLNSYSDISTFPVDGNASAATKSLYNYLYSLFGKKIISGQTNGYYDDIKTITGKSPLYRTWDFQHYTEGYPYLWKNGGFSFGIDTGAKDTENAIAWYNSTGKKGIVGFHWHWHSPSGGTVGTNTFYTASTTFDIRKAVQTGTTEYNLIIRDIDAIAAQLKKLQAANVPVLFRPLHEAGGAWFWWGAQGGAACKQLYAILFDRLTNFHQIHNLIWVWSTPESDWYPGNDKVDIVGHDSYPGNFNYGTQKNAFDKYLQLTGGKKIVTMSENGPIPDPDACLDFDSPWSFFMSWNDLVKSQNSAAHLKDVYTNPRVLTLENDTLPMIISTTNASICGSEAVTLSAISNFGTVNWYDAATGGKLIFTGTTYTTPVLTIPTTYYVEASYNGRPSIIKRLAVTAVASTPIISASISGTAVVCQGSSNIAYSVPYDVNVVSYVWTLPTGATPAFASTTNTIFVNFGSNAQPGNITVNGHNACGDGPLSSFAVSVNTLPSAAGKITGTASVCANSGNVTYNVPEIAGASSYEWTLPSGATGTSATNQILVNFSGSTILSGNIKVKGVNGCGYGTESAFTIAIKPLPAAAGKITGSASICRSSELVTYSVPTITSATSYIWTLSSGATGTSTSRIISLSFDPTIVAANIRVKGRNDCGDGPESSLDVIINEVPSIPVVTLNNGILQSAASSGNQWYMYEQPIPNAIGNTYIPIRSGDYYSIVTLNGCASDPSGIVSVFRTEVDKVAANEAICIFPNPIERGITKITFSGMNRGENTSVKIFDINGKLVFSDFITGTEVNLRKGLDSGIYIVNVVNNGVNYSEKLIVK